MKKYSVIIDAEDVAEKEVREKWLWASGTHVSYMGLGLFVQEEMTARTTQVQKNGGLAVDDIAIYKKALTQDEIKAYFDDPTPNAPTQKTDYVHKKTYYVDSVNGNDMNNGTSPETAFKSLERVNDLNLAPGASVLFKKGCTFEGKLVLTASGTEEKPIVISSYGEGNEKPILAGCGVLPGTVHMLNCEYITVSGLEITNIHDVPERRSGFYIEAKNSGILHNITINDCYIHDIIGDNYNSNWGFYRLTGGIICYPNGLEKPSAFDGLLIENNEIEYADHSGILVYSSWCNRDGIFEGYGKWTPSVNVVVRNNRINVVGGDGIQIGTSDGTLVERNVVYYANGIGKYRAGIWPWNSDNCVYQYNEVGYTKCVEGDGQGYDLDFGTSNNIMQYNYSHDNEGGFLLACSYQGVTNTNSIFRYNISVNDKGIAYRIVGVGTSGCKIYNNLVYNDNLDSVFWLLTTSDYEGDVKEVYFYNNIFYSAKGARWSVNDTTYLINNCFYSGNGVGAPKGENNILENPMFAGRVDGEKVKELTEFMLSPDSPCRNAGYDIPESVVKNIAEADYFGNIIDDSKTDIGPHQISD